MKLITLITLFVMAAIVGIMAVIMQAAASYTGAIITTLGGL